MVDAVLFELEGVVFETGELRLASLRDAVAAQGLELMIDAETVAGLAPRAAIAAVLAYSAVAMDDVATDLLVARAERAFSSRLSSSGIAVRPGAQAFVRATASVAPVGAVTRASRSDSDAMLRLSGLDDVFALCVCAEDALDGKPSPVGYVAAIDRLSRRRTVARGSVLALEDAAPGIRAARAAGVRCVAIGPMSAHVAMEADAYVASLRDQSVASLDQLTRPGQERVQ